jgi:hypothetical protein
MFSSNLTTVLPAQAAPESRHILEDFPRLVDKVFPLPGRFRSGLARDVAELSRLLTSGRGDRPEGYLGRPPLLSAYLRYFLPWNLYRLVRLLPALPLVLDDGDAVTDLGSGPLTLPLALWIARPELHSLNLEIRCLDRTEAALKSGKLLFAALAGPACPWKIRTIRASLDAPVKGPPSALVTAVNIYNEVFWDIPHVDSRALALAAGQEARRLSGLASPNGAVLVVEPGIPRSGEFIACLRTALLERGRPPLAPCTHTGSCPFPGGMRFLNGDRPSAGEKTAARGRRTAGEKQKWCHFAFDAADAPRQLRELSAAAGLPKERVDLSFLFAGGVKRKIGVQAGANAGSGAGSERTAVRVLSDPFSLQLIDGKGGRYGRYGCSGKGAVLLTGEKRGIDALGAGTLLSLPLPEPGKERRDPKTGALALAIPQNTRP